MDEVTSAMCPRVYVREPEMDYAHRPNLAQMSMDGQVEVGSTDEQGARIPLAVTKSPNCTMPPSGLAPALARGSGH